MTSALTPVAADTTPLPDDLEDQHLIPRIQAVCLDIDDTLVDFTSSARKALRTMIGRDDLWPTWQRLTDEHVAKVIAGEMDACTMRVAPSNASRRLGIGVVPACDSMPCTVQSNQRCPCNPWTTPITRRSASRMGPCSICASK